ncbi:GGDEF domain-containing protein [Mycobacterium sp. 236(2023)]|uniref:GGDEF domain-containing protein n=1 Tax=Mycobacterium sp. 236(2023) TaxID=3038163 RepID=UPI002414E1B9|nr:GGDEF domain-containing protein [Mycobacterium sp. 236(2023)]MDG4663988.1 GGDEF domain-containing protein [Mycobacterium sp. 236(2023)]
MGVGHWQGPQGKLSVMHLLSSLAGADGRVFGRQKIRLLRIYLAATTFLYAYGVTFTLFPVRTDLEFANPAGGIAAIVLGIAALGYLAFSPQNSGPALAAAIVATPLVIAFHVTLTSIYVCMTASMFLAMYVRAFYSPRRAAVLIALLTGAVLAAVAVSPAPHVGVITFLIIAVAIVGTAESFGIVMRALLTAACTDPMTGLFNRAGWEIATAELLTGRRPQSDVVTVVALDIDKLKHLNDTYGHDAGDRRITEYATAWRAAAPRGAILARLGGDEFAGCIAARDGVAETFVQTIRASTPEVSIGTATGRTREIDIPRLLRQADEVLYASRGKPLRDAEGS